MQALVVLLVAHPPLAVLDAQVHGEIEMPDAPDVRPVREILLDQQVRPCAVGRSGGSGTRAGRDVERQRSVRRADDPLPFVGIRDASVRLRTGGVPPDRTGWPIGPFARRVFRSCVRNGSCPCWSFRIRRCFARSRAKAARSPCPFGSAGRPALLSLSFFFRSFRGRAGRIPVRCRLPPSGRKRPLWRPITFCFGSSSSCVVRVGSGVLLALAYKVESEKKQHGKYNDSVRNIRSADSCFSSRRFFCLS